MKILLKQTATYQQSIKTHFPLRSFTAPTLGITRMSSQIDLDSNQTYTNTSSVSTSKTTLTIELDDIDDITIQNNGALYFTGKRGIDTLGDAYKK